MFRNARQQFHSAWSAITSRRVKLPLFAAFLLSAANVACGQTSSELAAPAEEKALVLQDHVSQAKAEHDIIALGAVVASSEGILDIAVDGLRVRGEAAPVEVDDQWHLGSNTKALTALLYGQLVLQGKAEWGARLPDLFPHLADEMDPAWTNITIEDLFAHRSGLRQMGGFWLNARRNDVRQVTEQRAELAKQVLTAPPSKDPSAFDYNNLNYILAGAAIEHIMTEDPEQPVSWEAAMQSVLFDQLTTEAAQTGFGFGAPPAGLEGHRTIFGAFPSAVGRGKTADNPAILGPAGTLHGTLSAHATLAIEFLKDESALVPVALREKLFAPHPSSDAGYAMGWGVLEDPIFGQVYLHSGSNTMWLSQIVISPSLDRVVIVNANQFGDNSETAIREVVRAVLLDAQAKQATAQ